MGDTLYAEEKSSLLGRNANSNTTLQRSRNLFWHYYVKVHQSPACQRFQKQLEIINCRHCETN